MIEVERRVRIARPPASVYAHLSRPESYPVWLPGMRSLTILDDGPVRPGTPVALELDGPTGRIQAQGSITDVQPDRRVALEAAAAQLRFETSIDLAPADGLAPDVVFDPASDPVPVSDPGSGGGDLGAGATSGGIGSEPEATELTLTLRLELLGGLAFLEGLARAQAIGEVGKALERLRAEIET